MQRKAILSLLLSTSLLTPAIDLKPSFLGAEQSVERNCSNFRNVRMMLDEEFAKIKEAIRIKEDTKEVIEGQEIEIVEENTYVTFNPYNLLEPSNITREQMYNVLEGTALQTLSDGYVYMEEVYGINALFLVSLSAEESGWGTSELAMYNNNIGGIKSSTGDWEYFNDWFECLSFKADLLYNDYLKEDGAYYNGLSIWNVNTSYCEQSTWADNISSIAYELLDKANNLINY